MESERENGKSEGLTCPHCGAVLVKAGEPSQRCITASFPADLDGVHFMALGGADFAKCPVCSKIIRYPALALCVFHSLGRVLLYSPAGTDAELVKRQLAEQLAESWPAERGEPPAIEVLSDLVSFQRKLAYQIAGLVLPVLAEFGAAADAGNLAPWMSENWQDLDADFFAGLWLLGQPGLPITIHRKRREAETGPADYVHPGTKSVEGAEPMPAREAQDMMHGRLEQLLELRSMSFAQHTLDTRAFGSLPEAVEEWVPKQVVTADFCAKLGQLADGLDADGRSMHAYAVHAVLASLCHFAGQVNPAAAGWTSRYVFATHSARINPAFPQDLGVDAGFAAKTINPRTLWDIYGSLLNRVLSQSGEEEQKHAFAVIETISNLVTELGFSDYWAEWITERFQINIDKVPDGELEEFAETFAKDNFSKTSGLRLLYPILQRELVKRDQALLHRLMLRWRTEALAAGRIADAIFLTAQFSKQWNDLGASQAAWTEVNACIAALQQLGAWPPENRDDHVMLLTEQANCLRYRTELSKALAVYEQIRELLPRELALADVRVNDRNRAIVLRDLGRVNESIELLTKLLEHENGARKRPVMHSIATAHLLAGRYPEAEQWLRRAAETAGPNEPPSDQQMRIVLTEASLALKMDDHRRAIECADLARKIASDLGNSRNEAVAAGLGAIGAFRMSGLAEEAPQRMEEAIEKLYSAISASTETGPDLVSRGTLHSLLSTLLWNAGDLETADKVLELSVRFPGFYQSNQDWGIWLNLAQLAKARRELPLARERLMNAYRSVVKAVKTIDPKDDLVNLMEDKDTLQLMLCREFLELVQQGKEDASTLRLMADFQASLLLSSQLAFTSRRRAGLSEPLEEIRQQDPPMLSDETGAALETLAISNAQGAAVLQFFRTERDVHLLVTNLPPGRASGFETQLADWSAPYRAISSAAREAWHSLARCSPARPSDPLAELPGWQALAAPLRAAVRTLVPEGVHLCLIPGVLGGIPLQYVFGDDHPLSYAPSLSAAGALRSGRLSLEPGGRQWRPRNLCEFVVWKAGEPKENILEFQCAAAMLMAGLEPHECEYEAIMGTEATREKLFEALARSDCVRLSCHGRGDSKNLRFDLLVACGGHLPPGHPTVLAGKQGEPFLVGWQELSLVRASSPLVFSAACTSGLTATLAGGERVGLERALLRAGTVSYVAPQWPVRISMIQPLVNEVILHYLADPERSLAEVVFAVTRSAIADGIPLRVARSLVVHGDWL